MLHQPFGSIGGQASDIEITAKEIRKIKHELYSIIAHHTEKDIAQVEQDCDRDFWMNADESKAYGVVDEVLVTNPRKVNK
jgi:ATP-dependent Clp protease protease subunit